MQRLGLDDSEHPIKGHNRRYRYTDHLQELLSIASHAVLTTPSLFSGILFTAIGGIDCCSVTYSTCTEQYRYALAVESEPFSQYPQRRLRNVFRLLATDSHRKGPAYGTTTVVRLVVLQPSTHLFDHKSEMFQARDQVMS
jgi:hypothetical protein